MKKSILMIVYNDITRDARVQRSILALKDKYQITLVSYGTSSNINLETLNDKLGCYNILFSAKSKKSIVRYITFVFKIFLCFRKKKFDLIYAHDFFSTLPMLLLRLFQTSKKFVYDAHELYIPEKNQKFGLRNRLFYFFEKKAIKKADLVICAQENRSQIMKEHYKLNRFPIVVKNISYLPNNNNLPDEITLDTINFLNEKPVSVVYAGAISKSRRLFDLVEAVNEQCKDFSLLIIGDGNYFDTLKNKILNMKNPYIKIYKGIPYEKLSSVLKKFKVGYLFYPNKGLNNIYCAPNKIYEYASVGLPIISLYNPTIEKILLDYRIGVCGDNLRDLLKDIYENIYDYKVNINKFILDNKWEDEAEKLNYQIKNLLSGE